MRSASLITSAAYGRERRCCSFGVVVQLPKERTNEPFPMYIRNILLRLRDIPAQYLQKSYARSAEERKGSIRVRKGRFPSSCLSGYMKKSLGTAIDSRRSVHRAESNSNTHVRRSNTGTRYRNFSRTSFEMA